MCLNTIELTNQNELLRAVNAKQTIKRANYTKKLLYKDGYIAGKTNELVVVERNEMKVVEAVLAGPSETTQSLPHSTPTPRGAAATVLKWDIKDFSVRNRINSFNSVFGRIKCL